VNTHPLQNGPARAAAPVSLGFKIKISAMPSPALDNRLRPTRRSGPSSISTPPRHPGVLLSFRQRGSDIATGERCLGFALAGQEAADTLQYGDDIKTELAAIGAHCEKCRPGHTVTGRNHCGKHRHAALSLPNFRFKLVMANPRRPRGLLRQMGTTTVTAECGNWTHPFGSVLRQMTTSSSCGRTANASSAEDGAWALMATAPLC
jgi:hypothetical protein